MPETSGTKHHAGAGTALVCLGLALLALMVAHPERLRVPPPVGYLTAGTLVLAGLLALANAFWGARVRAWLAVALLSCMMLPSAWIAIGPGQRTCTTSFGGLFRSADGLVCRTAFGIGSILVGVMVLVALRHALRAGKGEN